MRYARLHTRRVTQIRANDRKRSQRGDGRELGMRVACRNLARDVHGISVHRESISAGASRESPSRPAARMAEFRPRLTRAKTSAARPAKSTTPAKVRRKPPPGTVEPEKRKSGERRKFGGGCGKLPQLWRFCGKNAPVRPDSAKRPKPRKSPQTTENKRLRRVCPRLAVKMHRRRSVGLASVEIAHADQM